MAYYRIIRPLQNNPQQPFNYAWHYYQDPEYCKETRSLIHAFHLIQSDFKQLVDYIELHDDNKSVYSHRIYELLLRTCTEFENNCTGILKANGYDKKNLDITDYFKINKASKLNEYEVKINIWSPDALVLKPFSEWNSENYTSLFWYKNYNSSKHNRTSNFSKANLESLINAIGGLFAILASQFFNEVLNPYHNALSLTQFDGFMHSPSSIFSVKFPTTWTEGDCLFLNKNSDSHDNKYHQYPFNCSSI